MSSFSITIRFRVLNKSIIDTFTHYCIGSTNGYLFSLEKGSSDEVNHIQAFITFNKKVRNDSIKRTLYRKFKKVYDYDEAEKLSAIKVKPSTDNDYVIGYCLKEQNEMYSNLDEDYIQRCKDFYVSKQNDKLKSIKVSKNNIVKVMLSYMKLHNISKEHYIASDITDILGKMANDYYEFCWIGKRNIEDIVNYLVNVLNGSCEEYFNDLYNDSKYQM